jgi:hypothetical protein
MTDYEFKGMLDELGPIEQIEAFRAVFLRWLLRTRRCWTSLEIYPIVYVIG